MAMLGKKVLCALLALMMLLSLSTAALAGNTVLQVNFTGMYAVKDGTYQAVELSGQFEVYQNGSLVDSLNVQPGGENSVTLSSADSVHLIPVMDTIPDEITLNEYGYGIAIAEGRLNIAPLTVYANAGLFVVEGSHPSAYELLDEDGKSFMTFDTDEEGNYELELAIPAGVYTLRMTASTAQIREEEQIEILNYTGPESVLRIDHKDAAEAAAQITPEPTAAPTAEPTATPAPTEAPTATPTAEPIATPVPTEAPTATPTATPVPTEVPTATPTVEPTPEPTPAVGSVSGEVKDLNGKAMKNVAVTVYDQAGAACAEAVTDQNGAWQVAALNYGQYTAVYAHDNAAVPATVFTLDGSANAVVLSAAAVKPAKLSVRVFEDENNNGVRNKSEGYIKNTEVALVSASGIAVASGMTDKNGAVTLNAPAGSYTLRVTAPENYGFGKQGENTGVNSSSMDESAERTQSLSGISLTNSATLELGIGLQPMATVTGTVWNDLNADGLWQKEEPGIPGIRVTIEGTRNGIYRETVTDENGRYELTQLKKGSYKLNCHVPDAYVFTVKAKGDLEEISRMTTEADRIGEDSFSLERGETHADHNIGMMNGAIIEGVCFLDENYNGYFDEGEKTLPGVEMRLARQSNNVLLQQTVTDANGAYHFYGQRGSTFTIRATLPNGYVFSATAEGENGNRFAPNGKKTERRLTDVTLEDSGYLQVMVGAVAFGSISGRVYFDENFSATWEREESIGEGFLVTLTDENGNKILAKKSDRNGNFTFEDLNPGQYRLKMSPEKGYAFTALGAGNVMNTQADGTGLSRVIDLSMGEEATGMGIGMIRPAKVSGVVFADTNDNGLLDKGEKGLKGTVVRLMGKNGETAALTVDASGEFVFNAVLPGTYHLEYELPDRAVYAPVQQGGNAMSSDTRVAISGDFTVDVEDAYNAPLCGGTLLSDIAGVAFADSNGNGVMDAGEPALAGMSITLIPSRNEEQVLNAVTGADGAFAFSSLHPDTYSLTVVCPDASVLSRMPHADLGLAHGLNSQTVQLQVEMGAMLTEQFLGCVLPSKWTGEAYLDENYDGMRAANEAPAAGETILLLDADSGETVASVLTDENGRFTIEGIAPGEYELAYRLDDGTLVPKAGDNHLHQEGDRMTTGRIRVKENEDMSGTVIAFVRTTELAGLVWLEEYDGVTPVAGAKVFLLDETGAHIAECTTGETGRYSFKGLMPGEYSLEVTTAAGYVLVEKSDAHLAEAGLISVLEEADGLHGRTSIIELRMAKHQLQMDIGNVLPGRLGDKVWLDLNGNGLQDGGEGGIPGVTIELLRGERVVASTVSDQYGYYVFENLYPTEYTLRVTWPEGIRPTVARTDVHQIVSILQESGLSTPVTVESNKANYAADLGFVPVEQGVLPAGYGDGETQVWKKK